MRKEDEKLRELILYIADINSLNPKFGKTKLYKVLFYSDFYAHFHFGQSITGQKYLKLPFGPAPMRAKSVLKKMEAAGEIATTIISYPRGPQHRISPTRAADLTEFQAREISLVEHTNKRLWNHDADQVSDLSHEFVGWKITELSKEIPIETVYIVNPDETIVSQKAREKAKRFAAQE